MKKTYTTPKVRAYKIEPATLMAASDAVNRSTNLDDLGWFNDDEGTKENNISYGW